MLRTIGSTVELAALAQNAYRRALPRRWASVASAQYATWHADALSVSAPPGTPTSAGGGQRPIDRTKCWSYGCGDFVRQHTHFGSAERRAISTSSLKAEVAKARESVDNDGQKVGAKVGVKSD